MRRHFMWQQEQVSEFSALICCFSQFGASRVPAEQPNCGNHCLYVGLAVGVCMEQAKTLLISPMRNEGPFLLEWVAWHRALGFDDILILSNDCTDGSDKLLDALADRRLIAHVRHSPKPGSFALRSAFATARKDPLVAAADWVMVLDADEFLVVHVGAGLIHDLLAAHDHAPLGIAVHWKCFGDSGNTHWEPGLLRHQFKRCGAGDDPANMRFKSIFRDPLGFEVFSSHSPAGYRGKWDGPIQWVTSDGKPIRKMDPTKTERHQSTARRRITHEIAQVNHYAIKAQACLHERRLKWASSDRAGRYDSAFVARYNKNTHEDRSALLREAAFEAHYLPLRADPELAKLEQACIEAYRESLTA